MKDDEKAGSLSVNKSTLVVTARGEEQEWGESPAFIAIFNDELFLAVSIRASCKLYDVSFHTFHVKSARVCTSIYIKMFRLKMQDNRSYCTKQLATRYNVPGC